MVSFANLGAPSSAMVQRRPSIKRRAINCLQPVQFSNQAVGFCSTPLQNTYSPDVSTDRSNLVNCALSYKTFALMLFRIGSEASADYSWRRGFLGGERRLNRPAHV